MIARDATARLFVLFSSLLFCAWLGCAPLAATQAVGGTTTLLPPEITEWDVLEAIDRSILTRIAQAQAPADDGALGRNKPAYFSVRWQDAATSTILVALLEQNVRTLDLGIRALEYALAHQQPGGSFPIVLPPNTSLALAPVDYAVAATFFFSELGRSLLLLDGNA